MRYALITRFVLAVVLSPLHTHGQAIVLEVLGAAGNYASSVEYNVHWTIGEIEVATLYDSIVANRVSQGFNQVYPYSNGSAKENLLPCLIFPNPVIDLLQVQKSTETDALLKVFDFLGRQVMQQPLKEVTSQLDISLLSDGVYIIQIVESGEITHVCKFYKVYID